ncbi:hypothetical protein K3495_g4221 [Podosphaera aphanis]|nr:hypothetical protein K3495_g4221 [Podosphaera aphanis]
MFQIQDLATLATKNFQTQLRGTCLDASFSTCVRELYASTNSSDDLIRSVALAAAISAPQPSDESHIDVDSMRVLKLDCFRDILCQGGDFAVDYCTAVVDQCVNDAREDELKHFVLR